MSLNLTFLERHDNLFGPWYWTAYDIKIEGNILSSFLCKKDGTLARDSIDINSITPPLENKDGKFYFKSLNNEKDDEIKVVENVSASLILNSI